MYPHLVVAGRRFAVGAQLHLFHVAERRAEHRVNLPDEETDGDEQPEEVEHGRRVVRLGFLKTVEQRR